MNENENEEKKNYISVVGMCRDIKKTYNHKAKIQKERKWVMVLKLNQHYTHLQVF